MKRGTHKDTACPYIFFYIQYYKLQNCTYISWSVSRKIDYTTAYNLNQFLITAYLKDIQRKYHSNRK